MSASTETDWRTDLDMVADERMGSETCILQRWISPDFRCLLHLRKTEPIVYFLYTSSCSMKHYSLTRSSTHHKFCQSDSFLRSYGLYVTLLVVDHCFDFYISRISDETAGRCLLIVHSRPIRSENFVSSFSLRYPTSPVTSPERWRRKRARF